MFALDVAIRRSELTQAAASFSVAQACFWAAAAGVAGDSGVEDLGDLGVEGPGAVERREAGRLT